MTTMTNVAVLADAWTLAHTAAADQTINIQHINASSAMRVRIGASAGTGDAENAACFIIQPLAINSFALKNGDKVLLRPHRTTSAGDASPMAAVVWA